MDGLTILGSSRELISRASYCPDCSSYFRACYSRGHQGSAGEDMEGSDEEGREDMEGSPRGGGFAVPEWDCFEKNY